MSYAFRPADILLPKEDLSPEKWAVIACDQFTSQPEFWQSVCQTVGDDPSTLHMILPEAWLGQVDEAAHGQKIREKMAEYLQAELFEPVEESFIYVRRQLKNGAIRRGIVGAVDLDQYDISPGSTSVLQASERIIASRLPARVEIRRGAPLELPHVLVLIDDPACTIVEGLDDLTKEAPLYDFPLMEGCGHLTGYRVSGPTAETVARKIAALPTILVGDGNHSLVAAKIRWDEMKESLSADQQEVHPARFALVELGNVHDASLEIEPIHRIVFGAGEALVAQFIASSPHVEKGAAQGQEVHYITQAGRGVFTITGKTLGQAIDLLQTFLDDFVKAHGGEIDYIHGETELETLAKGADSVAFFMPTINKGDLFTSVQESGVFPKKSFSMGEGADKRHYFECRKII